MLSTFVWREYKDKWHSTVIDYLELTKVDSMRPNVYQVTHPCFGTTIVLAKFAEFPWKIPFFEAETTAYSWLDGTGVGPKFLGHITEEGRIIGFLIEYFGDARSATAQDLAVCEQALRELHELNVMHGDINKYNFLIRDGGAVLIDFERAEKCDDKAELELELAALSGSLSDPSYRGGAVPPGCEEW